jgi:hypothetical protein
LILDPVYGSTLLTIATSGSAAPGSYVITITASSNGAVETTSLLLILR